MSDEGPTRAAQPIQAVKGTNDVWPTAVERAFTSDVWEWLFAHAAHVLNGHGFRQVWLPVLEETALYERSIGGDSDIVSKEMYTFADRGGRSLTLRPEGTAGAARAYIEHNLARGDAVQRWWYAGPMFRAERPQKGRYREFQQVGGELFGVAEPTADAELLLMLSRLCQRLRIDGVEVRLNTLGDAADRQRYRAVLLEYLRGKSGALCESCRARLDTNPLRVLDCKRESCRAAAAGAPDILASAGAATREHFDAVQEMLTNLGVPFVRDARLVRGLDYYTRTTFEFTSGALGAQDAILGGGRYDDLVETLGGPPTPAIGFAAGVERLALLVQGHAPHAGADLYLIPMAGAERRALHLADELRSLDGVRVEVDTAGGKLKQQMRRADRAGARFALVLGEEETKSGRGRLKDLTTGSEVPVELNAGALRATLKRLAGGGRERQG